MQLSCIGSPRKNGVLSKNLQGVREPDSLAPNRAQAHRPAGLSVGTSLTGAVAAPDRFAVSPRLPFNKLKKYRTAKTSAVDGVAM